MPRGRKRGPPIRKGDVLSAFAASHSLLGAPDRMKATRGSRSTFVRSPDQRERDTIRTYVESQADEPVAHHEKAGSELVGMVRHDIWDVQCATARWWVVTNPTNLYDQADFKSRDVVLTFHVGLALRLSFLQDREVPSCRNRRTCCRVRGVAGSRHSRRTTAAMRPRPSRR